MLDALVVLCGIFGVFYWWLSKNYGTSSGEEYSPEEKEKHVSSRRRGRGRNKKGKDKSAKTTPVQELSTADATSADVQRSLKSRGPTKQQLDAQEWPTLGADNQGLPRQQEDEENLAALHAKMLKATRSASPARSGKERGGGTAGGRRAAAGEGRSSGRIGVGDKVEGRFEARAEWFPAIVTKVARRSSVAQPSLSRPMSTPTGVEGSGDPPADVPSTLSSADTCDSSPGTQQSTAATPVIAGTTATTAVVVGEAGTTSVTGFGSTSTSLIRPTLEAKISNALSR